MGNLGFSIFLIQFLFGAVEIPANLLSMWLLEVFGRKALFIFTLVIGGLSSLLIVAVPQGKPFALIWHYMSFCCWLFVLSLFLDLAPAVTSLAVAARFFLVWAGSVTCVYMQELSPTSVRWDLSVLVLVLPDECLNISSWVLSYVSDKLPPLWDQYQEEQVYFWLRCWTCWLCTTGSYPSPSQAAWQSSVEHLASCSRRPRKPSFLRRLKRLQKTGKYVRYAASLQICVVVPALFIFHFLFLPSFFQNCHISLPFTFWVNKVVNFETATFTV